jgi:exopolysaccharide biosynthesis protein
MKEMKHIVAGGPRLVHSGNPCVTSKEENFRADVARSRANRTGAGITRNGELILLTVERATLNELARLMIELGAYDAMNLDGGGSSGMAAGGRTLFGGMRPVPNAIVVRKKGSSVL